MSEVQIFVSLLLIVLVLLRPTLLAEPAGRLLALVALVALPLLATGAVGSFHLDHAKRTSFCLACHEMSPFGESLEASDASGLSAVHFQNHLVPRNQACYACHTHYAMHGDVLGKVRGLRHAWVHYMGPPVETAEIALYEPYRNENCLRCHGDARSFEEALSHASVRGAIANGKVSCLACHGPAHAVGRGSPTIGEY